MADALPIAGVSVGDTLRFGTTTVTNSRWTVAPSGWDSSNFGRSLTVYDPNQNGSSVPFSFEQAYTPPSPLNIAFDFSNDRLAFIWGLDSSEFGRPSVTRTPSFDPVSWDSCQFGVARIYDTAVSSSIDFNLVGEYTTFSPLNVEFVFSGAKVVSGASLGDTLKIGGAYTVENTAKQFWPNGSDYLSFGKVRLSDQFDTNFVFTETYPTLSSASVRFDFLSASDGTRPIMGQGWDSCQFGMGTRVVLQDIAVNFTGWDSCQFGTALLYDLNRNPENLYGINFSFVESPRYPNPLNVPFYFSWVNRIYGIGWDSCAFGGSWVSNWVRYLQPNGLDSLQFGSPERVWNYHQWVYPIGVDFSQVGSPVKVWNYHQWVYANGSYYTQFGVPEAENTAVPIYPGGNSFVGFGDTDVRLTSVPIYPYGLDSAVFGENTVDHVPDYYVTTNILLLPPLVSVDVSYNSSVDRPTVCMRGVRHQLADKFFGTVAQDKYDLPEAIVSTIVSKDQLAITLNAGVEHKLPGVLKPRRETYVHPWLEGLSICTGAYSGQQDGVGIGNDFRMLGEYGDPVENTYLHKSPGMLVGSRQSVEVIFQPALPFLWGYEQFYDEAVEFETGSQMWWQEAVPPQPGVSFVPPEPPLPPKCYTPNPHLVFKELQEDVDGNLLFVCEYVAPPDPDTILGQVIPYRKVYVVMNSIELFKKEGMVKLPLLAFGLDIDMDSWCWGFSCTVHDSALSHVGSVVTNEPVELVARVNGEDFELLAESISRNRSWESTSLSIQGRGKSAYLSSPYAPNLNFANTEPKNAQQLMVDALTYNGVSLGWGIAWDVEDWGVPSGVWSISGGYMDALLSVANACGAFILPHASQNILYIKPRYPAWPWVWSGVPNNQLIQIPSAVVETESIKWETKPSYTGVYVSGVSAGTLALVKKLGTAGDYLDTMVTDSLITSAAAARQRGGTILSQTGRMAIVSLSLPILPETGIIRPGRLVKYVDNGTDIIGLVKSVSASMQGGPSLRQSIELEVHYG